VQMRGSVSWRRRARRIRLAAFDVDGVLTDGSVLLTSEGDELKRFSILDGMGFRIAVESGLAVAVVSGRRSAAVDARMRELGVSNVVQGAANKPAALRELAARHGLQLDEVAFVGDDLNDLAAFSVVGLAVAVANACSEVKRAADLVTRSVGGQGAAREAIELIMKAQGTWWDAIRAYVAETGGAGRP